MVIMFDVDEKIWHICIHVKLRNMNPGNLMNVCVNCNDRLDLANVNMINAI